MLNAVGREELLDREADASEHGAGIILGGAHALLVGQAVIIGGDEKLGAALEADDRKLPQRNVHMAAAAADGQLLAKESLTSLGISRCSMPGSGRGASARVMCSAMGSTASTSAKGM